jgi:predicted glutamine amidotransferase
MCRMLAVAAQSPIDVSPYLEHLERLSLRGNLLERWEKRPGGNHPDGWGIAYRRGGETMRIRSASPAAADPRLAAVRATATRLLAHARYASNTATVNEKNAHPFLLDGVALAHNGTFRGRIGEEAGARNVSDTLVFLERLVAEWPDRSLPGLRDALLRLLGDRGLVGDYSAANFLVCAGEDLYALRRFRRDEGYYTLVLLAEEDRAVAASEPLDASPGWRPLENGELVELSPPAPRSVLLRDLP